MRARREWEPNLSLFALLLSILWRRYRGPRRQGCCISVGQSGWDGIENFKMLSLGNHSSFDSTVFSDFLRSRMWEMCLPLYSPPPTQQPIRISSLSYSRIPNLEVGLPVPEHAQNLLKSIEKMSRKNTRLIVHCQELPKGDLVRAFSSFPNLANVKLHNADFPMGDIPVPPTLKKLYISTPRLQLPSLELLSNKQQQNWQITLKGTETYQIPTLLSLEFTYKENFILYSLQPHQDAARARYANKKAPLQERIL